ncbi:MAG: lytic transglycosylase domain-containing protein [Vicinamibacterales bacterium]
MFRGPHLLIRLALAATCLAAAVSRADAQIYTWRDANGNLVLSDRPHEGADLRTFEVPKTTTVRVTRSISARADAYEDLIVGHATLNNIRPDLVRAVIQVESGFNPRAVSPKGALGLMQLMPATARQLRVSNAFDPEENIRGGVAYLRQLLDRYDGNEELALAAYNAGPGAVDRHGQSIPPYRETRSYVSKISGLVGAAGRVRATSSTRIYRVVEVIDGREIIRYTDKKPAAN